MEASLRRENTRIRDRLAALRCRGGEDAVLFGAAPPGVPIPESAPSAKLKYQPPSQLTTASASASATKELQVKGGVSARPNLSEDLVGAIENLIRTILEDKDERVSKANCYRALHKYASAQLEIRQVRVQLIRLQREATPDNSEQQIVKLGEFLKDLQVIHTEQSRIFREALEAKDAQLYYQEEKLKASTSQVKELQSQLQLLRERSLEYEHEIRCLNAALMGGDPNATAGVESQHPPLPVSGESQEEKDLKIKELQAQLDALMSVKSGELDGDVDGASPPPDSRQASLSEVSMGDYCDFLEPSVEQVGASKATRSKMVQETPTSTAEKHSKPAEGSGAPSTQPSVGCPSELDEPQAIVQQGSRQSLDVLANECSPVNDAPNCVIQKATSNPVAIRSILRKPKHSAPLPAPPQTPQVDATDADASQDIQVGSSNVSLDLLVAMDKGGGGGPRCRSPVVKSKGACQKQPNVPPIPMHPTGAGGSSDASIDFLVRADKASIPTQAAPARTVPSSTTSGTAAGTYNSEGSLDDFDFGGSNECEVNAHPVVAQTSNCVSTEPLSTSNRNDDPNDPSGSMSLPSSQKGYVGSEPSLQDDLFGEESGAIEQRREDDDCEEEKKDSDDQSSVGTVPDNQKGFDESEGSLPDELFPADDSSSEGVTMHHDDAGFVTQSKVGMHQSLQGSKQTLREEPVVGTAGGSEEGVEATNATMKQTDTKDSDECSSVASPVPDNQGGFDTSEASLLDELFVKPQDDEIDSFDGTAASGVPPASSQAEGLISPQRDGPWTSPVGLHDRGRSASEDDGTQAGDVSPVAVFIPDIQNGFDKSASSLENERFASQVDDKREGDGKRVEVERELQSDESSSAATSVPDNQKRFDLSEPSLLEELFSGQGDGSEHSVESNGKVAPAADVQLESSRKNVPDAENSFVEGRADEHCHGYRVEDGGNDGDVLSTCTPEPDNQKGYDASEGSLNDDLFDDENDADLDVIEEDDEASSIATEPDKHDGQHFIKPESSTDKLEDDAASTATPAPDNQQGFEASEGSMTDELFAGKDADDHSSSETAAAPAPVLMEGGTAAPSPSHESETPANVAPQSPVKEGIIFIEDNDPQSPDFRDLTVDASTIGDLDEGQDESSTIDSVTGVSYLHGSEELTEQLVNEACAVEERKPADACCAPPADPDPSSAPQRADGLVSSPASRAERVIHHALKRQDTVSSTFGVDSLQFLTAGSLQGDDSQRSVTKRSSRHSKHFDESRLNRSVSTSRSRPPLFAVPEVKELKPSNNEHAPDIEKALELSASRARSIELSRKVEQLTLQLEQERIAFSNEHKSVQLELQGTKAAIEKYKGTVATLEKELTETEYNLVQAKHKVSMLETYVVEDLVPPDDVIEACYASKGRIRQSPNEGADDSEVKLLKKDSADLRNQLTVANTLVIKLEDDRSRQLKKIADLTELLQANKDSKKRLFEKSVECADLASERDLIQVHLVNLREKNSSLELKLSETLDELEDLRISSANKSVRDFAIPAEHLEERERTLNRVMETSIELAECKMNLDRVTEQLKAEQKKNQELAASIADLDRSSSLGGLRTRVSTSLNLSNHSPSPTPTPRGGRNLLGLSTGMLSNSYHGTPTRPEATDVQRLQRTVAELEQQNEAYRLQVASLKQKSRMGTVQE